jgi:uncharacterized protein (TIGR01777 family)
MKTEQFVMRSPMPASADEVYRWHARHGALERLTPPWETVQVLNRQGGIEDGGKVVLAVRAGGVWRRWVARHHDHEPGRQFCDTQVEGPFARWEHSHRFVPDGPAQSYLEDKIEYALPFRALGHWLGSAFIRWKLQGLFRYRHRTTAQDLALHQKYKGDRPMNVLVSGSTGLIGSALVPFLTTGGHRVVRLVRSLDRAGENAVYWNPAEQQLDVSRLEGMDAVVHLAGENIAARRWNAEQKARIRNSRVESTMLLCQALGQLKNPPRVLVAASAVGYYGSRDDSWLEETSTAGDGFLAGVCREWEAATKPAASAGIRVVNLRLGVVLSPAGGALASMLTPFRLGLGGRIGSGGQFMSWIALDDVLGAIYHALATPEAQGPVNAVAPHPVTNREFSKTLGRVLWRPTLFPLPAFAARLAFGEMAEELLLASARVNPGALLGTGYPFRFPTLEPALRHLLGKEAVPLYGESTQHHQPPQDILSERRADQCAI